MATRARHLSLTLLAAGSVAVAVGCSDGDDSAGDTLATIATPTVEPTTEPPPPTTAPPSTAPPSTSPPTTEEPTTTSTSTTSTTAPPTTAVAVTSTTSAPTTVAPASTPTPGPTGLGVVDFGAGADATVQALTAALGAPTADSGWVEPGRVSSCGGTEARRVEWGVLSVVLGAPQAGEGDPRQFIAYAYGDVSEVGAEPSGLRTAEGIGLGSSVAELQAAYPDVEVFAGEEGLFEASFSIAEGFAGLLTSEEPDGAVTVIYGGPCE